MAVSRKQMVRILAGAAILFIAAAFLLVYLHLADLKDLLIARLSRDIALSIGRELSIRNVTLGPPSSVTLYGISVERQEVGGKGILTAEKLRVDLRLGALMRRRVSIKNMTATSLVINVIRGDTETAASSNPLGFLSGSSEAGAPKPVESITVHSGTINYLEKHGGVLSLAGKVVVADAVIGASEGGRSFHAALDGVQIEYLKKKASLGHAIVNIHSDQKNNLTGTFSLSQGKAALGGSPVLIPSGTGAFGMDRIQIHIPRAVAFGGTFTLNVEAKPTMEPFPIRATVQGRQVDLDLLGDSGWIPIGEYRLSGKLSRITFSGVLRSREDWTGQASLEGENLSFSETKTKRKFAGFSANGKVEFAGKDLGFSMDAEKRDISFRLIGRVLEFGGDRRLYIVRGVLPAVRAESLRGAFLELVPASFADVKLSGGLSSDIHLRYGRGENRVDGQVQLSDFYIEAPRGDYRIGPITGTLPIGKSAGTSTIPETQRFKKSEFENLYLFYSEPARESKQAGLSIERIVYGLEILRQIRADVRQDGPMLRIQRFSAGIFGGMLYGSASFDFSRSTFETGFLLKGLSLKMLTDNIPPIRGYISGVVDGIGALWGDPSGLTRWSGMADFWTYQTSSEKTEISRELLEKLASGPMRIYARTRHYDEGKMSVYLRDGFITFREMEVSNRNFLGIRDLLVTVAPTSNRIRLEDLLGSIREAAKRAEEKKKE